MRRVFVGVFLAMSLALPSLAQVEPTSVYTGEVEITCTDYTAENSGSYFLDRDNTGLGEEAVDLIVFDGRGTILSSFLIQDVLGEYPFGVIETTLYDTAPAANPITFALISHAGNGLPEQVDFVAEGICESITFVPDTVGHVDPKLGLWHLRNEERRLTSFFYGVPGDVPFMGDWDGDGVDTPGLFRKSSGFAYLRNSNTQGFADISFFFGNPGDIPIAGDFDFDGFDTVSIYRPSEGKVYIVNELGANGGSLGPAEFSYFFGNPGDKPFVGDFDGDGVETVGLHRESSGLVYFRNSHTTGIADNSFFFGIPGDRFVAGDWTGGGFATPGVFRPSTINWYFRHTNTQGVADSQFQFGHPSFLPVSGKFFLDVVFG
jgi:hypothetical protein